MCTSQQILQEHSVCCLLSQSPLIFIVETHLLAYGIARNHVETIGVCDVIK
jgi:hypothetical protein